jgi:hypothetical protein
MFKILLSKLAKVVKFLTRSYEVQTSAKAPAILIGGFCGVP